MLSYHKGQVTNAARLLQASLASVENPGNTAILDPEIFSHGTADQFEKLLKAQKLYYCLLLFAKCVLFSKVPRHKRPAAQPPDRDKWKMMLGRPHHEMRGRRWLHLAPTRTAHNHK